MKPIEYSWDLETLTKFRDYFKHHADKESLTVKEMLFKREQEWFQSLIELKSTNY